MKIFNIGGEQKVDAGKLETMLMILITGFITFIQKLLIS